MKKNVNFNISLWYEQESDFIDCELQQIMEEHEHKEEAKRKLAIPIKPVEVQPNVPLQAFPLQPSLPIQPLPQPLQ